LQQSASIGLAAHDNAVATSRTNHEFVPYPLAMTGANVTPV
jgi:hypothetical protein